MRKFYPYFFTVLAIILSTFIWEYIEFPYDENNIIKGEYFEKKYNPLNDTIRGIFFIFFPLFVFLIFFLKNENSLDILKYKENYFLKRDSYKNFQNSKLNFISIILMVFVIVEFSLLNVDTFLGKIDTHHEGPFLVAPLNTIYKKQMWLGTLFDYGAIGNNVGLIFSKIFGTYSVGIIRFGNLFFVLINKILLILICRKIVINLSLNSNSQIFFIIFTILSLSLATYHYGQVTPFHPRVFIYLVFFLLLLEVLTANKTRPILAFILGLFSLFSLMWYVDFGAYTNVALLIAITFLIYYQKYLNAIITIFSVLVSWLLFFIFVPLMEINEFFFQFKFLTNISDYLLGLEYPKPFTDKSTRHTKALLFIIVSGIFLINFLLNKKLLINSKTKITLLFIFISSILLFKSGLMRSDGPHIKYSSGFYMFLIYFSMTYFFHSIISKIDLCNKILLKKNFNYFVLILLCFFTILNNNALNINNIISGGKNIFYLTKVNDEKLLNENYSFFIKRFKQISGIDNCVQQFTDDNALPYFIKKPTCTQFYVNSHIIGGWTENKFIEQLKESRPSFIVYSSNINWFKDRKNAPKADNFIISNYSLYEKIDSWEIYKINNDSY